MTSVPTAAALERRVRVSDEAFLAAVKIRALVQRKTRMRPDMAIVIAAMLQRAAELPDIADAVARHGLEVLARQAGAPPSVSDAPAAAASP